MLPLYMIWPYLETLEILQILVVFSGVIPLHLILKKLTLPQFSRPLILLWFFVTPALTTAGGYHLHENCFLVPLLLWLIYANLSQWRKRLWLIAVLNLMVKEDAFIYVVMVGLYFLCQNRLRLNPSQRIQLLLSHILFPLIYFGFCLYMLSAFGEGGMVGRFDNFLLPGQVGLSKVVQNILLNPSYTFVSLFTQRKLKYIIVLLLTQAFLPLFQKRWENYFLIVPLVVINLLSDYGYQADFGFQYSYGSNILVFFMSLLALETIYEKIFQSQSQLGGSKHVIYQLVMTAIVFSAGMLYSFTNNWYQDMLIYLENKPMYQSIHESLEKIDKKQTILAFSAYTVSLREAEELYDIFYHNDRQVDSDIDLIVLPQSILEGDTVEAEVVRKYLEVGYQMTDESTSSVLIIRKQTGDAR